MKLAKSSSSPTASSSEKPPMIQVMLPKWVTEEAGLRSFALNVEKSGGEWFCLIRVATDSRSGKLLRFPARDTKINGVSLDLFLNAMVEAGYFSFFQTKP